MGVYKKKNRWYIDFYVDGKRKREAVKIDGVPPQHTSRQDALTFLRIKQAEAAKGEYVAKKEKPLPFELLASMYLEWAENNHATRTYENEKAIVKTLVSFFKDKNTNSIKLWDVERFKSRRKAKGIEPVTINKDLAVLRLMFNVAAKGQLKRKINRNPIAGIKRLKEPYKPIRILKDSEFQRLFEACSERLKPIVLCAFTTGMRRSEIAGLRWENIDFDTGYIHLEKTKTNEPRSIPINKLLFDDLKRLKKESKSDYVFPRPDGMPYTSKTTWRTPWLRALRASGIGRVRFHSLRHSFVSTLLVDEKEDFSTVMSLSGHRDIRMLKHYAHTNERAKKAAVDRLSERIKRAAIDTYMDTGAVTPISAAEKGKKKK